MAFLTGKSRTPGGKLDPTQILLCENNSSADLVTLRFSNLIVSRLRSDTAQSAAKVKHCGNRARGFSARARAIPFQLNSVCFRDKLGSMACRT